MVWYYIILHFCLRLCRCCDDSSVTPEKLRTIKRNTDPPSLLHLTCFLTFCACIFSSPNSFPPCPSPAALYKMLPPFTSSLMMMMIMERYGRWEKRFRERVVQDNEIINNNESSSLILASYIYPTHPSPSPLLFPLFFLPLLPLPPPYVSLTAILGWREAGTMDGER